jgi:hypothetical protein
MKKLFVLAAAAFLVTGAFAQDVQKKEAKDKGTKECCKKDKSCCKKDKDKACCKKDEKSAKAATTAPAAKKA